MSDTRMEKMLGLPESVDECLSFSMITNTRCLYRGRLLQIWFKS